MNRTRFGAQFAAGSLAIYLICPPVGRAVPTVSHTPWQMTAAAGGKRYPLASPPGDALLYDNFMKWAPPPDARWSRAPNPDTLDFEKSGGGGCKETVSFFYFRTTLNVPAGVDPSQVFLRFRHIDDGLAVWVNGKPVWHFRSGVHFSPPAEVPVGAALRPGPNAIRLLLGDWCFLAQLSGAEFGVRGAAVAPKRRNGSAFAPSRAEAPAGGSGEAPTVQFHSNPAHSPPVPRSAPRPEPGQADDWLRPRRDATNTSHSLYPLRIPPRVAWTAPYNVIEARIARGIALILEEPVSVSHAPDDSPYSPWRKVEPRGDLVALDLKTGKERWRYPAVDILGDVSETGRAAVLKTLEETHETRSSPLRMSPLPRQLTVLDVKDGSVVWQREAGDLFGPIIEHGGILYLFNGRYGEQNGGGIVRYRLSDGERLETITPPLEAWSLPAFSGDRLMFGGWRWLYDLSVDDLQRGTKFYGGGMVPLPVGDQVATESDWFRTQRFRQDGKWLRKEEMDRRIGGRHVWAPTGGPDGALVAGLRLGGLRLLDMAVGRLLWEHDASIAADTEIHSYDLSDRSEDPHPYLPISERVLLNLSAPRLLTMDDQIVREEYQISSSEAGRSRPPWAHGRALAVRDALNGEQLWAGKAFAGQPVAASEGFLLVASENRLICLH